MIRNRLGYSSLPLILAAACLFLALMPSLVWAHGGDAVPTTGAKIDGDRMLLSAAARKSLGVVTEKVLLRDLERTVGANATVEAPWFQQAIVTTLVSGKVDRVLVRPGEAVEAGQELARIESLELETLQLDMLRATTEIALANHTVEQREKLFQAGNIPERRLLESRAIRQQRIAELEIVRRKLLALGLDERTLNEVLKTGKTVRTIPIVSPRKGFISAADVRTGEFIDPSHHLYHIVDLSSVWVFGEVLETDSYGMEVELPVQLTFAALPGQSFHGHIHHIDLKVDTAHRTLPVTVDLDNPQSLVRPGMYGRMQVRVATVKEAVACPAAAILRPEHGRGPSVLLHDIGDTYYLRQVKLGMRSGYYVEVLDGLFPGDRVVTVGNTELAALFPRSEAETVKAKIARSKAPAGEPSAASNSTSRVAVNGLVSLPTFRKLFASSTIGGRIHRILIEHGQRVEKGQILAEVQSLELQTLQLDLLLARTKLNLARQSLDRFVRVSQEGAVSDRDLLQLQTERTTLESTVASLSRKLSLVGLTQEEIKPIEDVDFTAARPVEHVTGIVPIRAPAGGWIVDFDLVPGQVIEAQHHLFEIHDLSKVEVEGFVFEHEAGKIQVGQRATVTVSAEPGFVGTGTVLRKSPVLMGTDRVLAVWTELDNPRNRLKDGMFAHLIIDVSPPPPAITEK
jgi:RND family efflux transporter MFP subunit